MKYVITLCCIVCVAVIVFVLSANANNGQYIYNGEEYESTLIGDENTLIDDENIEQIPATPILPHTVSFESSEGFLETGITYVFNGEDFDFNEFRERIDILREEAVDSIFIAQTPAEVAEMAQHYLESIPPLHILSSELAEQLVIYVRYCSQTDHWLVGGTHLLPDPGIAPILAISRLDGSAVLIWYMTTGEQRQHIIDDQDVRRRNQEFLARSIVQG